MNLKQNSNYVKWPHIFACFSVWAELTHNKVCKSQCGARWSVTYVKNTTPHIQTCDSLQHPTDFCELSENVPPPQGKRQLLSQGGTWYKRALLCGLFLSREIATRPMFLATDCRSLFLLVTQNTRNQLICSFSWRALELSVRREISRSAPLHGPCRGWTSGRF